MPQKKKIIPSLLSSSKTLQKKCQLALKETLSDIQAQCNTALTNIKAAITDSQVTLKDYQTTIKMLEEKLATAKVTLSKKKTKTTENLIRRTKEKLKDSKRLLQHSKKTLEKLLKERDTISLYKAKSKARAIALKLFEKEYKPSVPSHSITASTKTALVEAGLRPGDPAPEFTSVLEGNQAVNLKQFLGRNVVLYFYPKDDTPGCTQEAKDFVSKAAQFDAQDTVIVGVSRDSMASHRKFAEKYAIPYTLLADTDEAICAAYGVIKHKMMYGKKVRGIERSTFLIDQYSTIKQIWRGVKVPGHVDDVLAAINAE